LVSYSQIASDAWGDTDPDIVTSFAKKHGIKVNFVSYDQFFPFSTKDDLAHIKMSPSFIQKSQVNRYLLKVSSDGYKARFTGEGGDELYWSNEEAFSLKQRFPVQKHFFEYQSLKKYGIFDVLTGKGMDFLLDKSRFKSKNYYPLLLSHSAVNLFLIMFPFSWEAGVWPMTPFADTRLLQVARGIPSTRIKKAELKQKLWHSKIGSIFLESQFRKKKGTEDHYGRYLTERTGFVVSTLKNSLLGQTGWANSYLIKKDLQDGNFSPYYEGDRLTYLMNLVEVEYFAQKNNIRVPKQP